MPYISVLNSVEYMLNIIRSQKEKLEGNNISDIEKQTCNMLGVKTSEGMEFVSKALLGTIDKEDSSKFVITMNEYYESLKEKEDNIK